MKRFLAGLGRGVQVVLALGLLGWIALAVHFQIPGMARYVIYVLLAGLALGFAVLVRRRRWGRLWLAMAAVLAVTLAWWSTIQPRQDRDWKADVAHGVTAEVTGDMVVLHNVRNFDWTSETEATERWETRTYDLAQLTSVDYYTSIWSSPLIAHTLLSFGFEDGRHIVFSGEIRKEKDEEFSSLGGFFREFELVLIAADERDIIRLRTDERGEQVAIYPITMPAELRKELFLRFVALGDELETRPHWYNTITANCTTIQYRLLRTLTDRAPLDPRVLLSGRSPKYLYDLGVIRPDLPWSEVERRAQLGKLGPAGDDEVAFSRHIRENWQD